MHFGGHVEPSQQHSSASVKGNIWDGLQAACGWVGRFCPGNGFDLESKTLVHPERRRRQTPSVAGAPRARLKRWDFSKPILWSRNMSYGLGASLRLPAVFTELGGGAVGPDTSSPWGGLSHQDSVPGSCQGPGLSPGVWSPTPWGLNFVPPKDLFTSKRLLPVHVPLQMS